jgi:hypothetical protein
MAATPDRIRPIIGMACMITLAVGAAALGRVGEQGPRTPATAANPERLTPFISGARGCAACHVLKNRTADTKEELDSWICRMDEFPTFDSLDKHKLAFQGLTGPRGQQMSRLLGTDVTQIEACVNCHSVPERGIEKHQYTREDDGVTCVACHGAYEEWVLKHPSRRKEWFELDRSDKERRFGMTDLWDPVRRALTCAACHIGNYAQGKVVTHAMYAAGHPPLPGFEAATFSDAQPRHWEYLSEKSRTRLERFRPAPDPKNLERTQLVVVNALVALSESMKLFADQSSANKPVTIGAQWPDFARFDCFACHHELQAQDGASWQQVRRRNGQPGRPMPPDWPWILVRLGIQAAGSRQAHDLENQLQKHVAKFHQSLTARPFGDAESAPQTARAAAAWADSLLKSLSHTVYDRPMARRLLERLCKMASETIPDYDSARQIAWAFRIIYFESLPQGVKPEPAIGRAVADLERDLALNLPPEKKQARIETALPNRLKVISEFDPRSFQAHFATIAKRL